MLKSCKIIGLNFDTYSALALAPRSEDLLSSNQPHFFAVTLTESDDAFTKTRQALADVEDMFYASQDPITQRLTEGLEMLKNLLKEAEKLEILLAATQNDEHGAVLYILGQSQQLRAILLRDEQESELYQESSEPQLISGLLKPGDRVFLATQSFKDLLDRGWERACLLPVETLEDEVASRLSEDHAQPLAAVVIDQIKEVEEEEMEEIPLMAQPRATSPKIAGAFSLRQLSRFKKAFAFMVLGIVVIFAGVSIFNKFKNNQPTSPRIEQGMVSLGGEDKKPSTASELSDWLDLNLVKKDFNTKKLSLSLGNILVQDSDKKVVVKIGLAKKSQQVLSGGDKLGGIKNSSLNGEVAWVLSDKGLIRIEGNQEPETVVKTDKEWGNIVDIYGFAGNIYILDEGVSPAGGQIWKYMPIAAGFSEKRNYFKEGVKANLSGAKKMQIDSSIWVLKSGGEILKFTQGSPDFFSLSGLEKPLKNPQSFFVSDETDSVYILDNGNNQLVVVDKKGVFQASYQSDKLGSVLDLVVDEKLKKVYLLLGSQILQMELR